MKSLDSNVTGGTKGFGRSLLNDRPLLMHKFGQIIVRMMMKMKVRLLIVRELVFVLVQAAMKL